MSLPPTVSGSGIKRPTSTDFSQSPNKKRATIPSDITSDRSFDHDRQLVPMISRAETLQFQDQLKDTSYTTYTENTSKEEEEEEEEEESEDEFVDAQEVVGKGSSKEQMTSSLWRFPVEEIGEVVDDIKRKVGISPVQKFEGSENVKDGDETLEGIEQGENIDLEEGHSRLFTSPEFQREEFKGQKIKPETISVDSDSDSDGEDEAMDFENSDQTNEAEDEDEKMSGTDVEDNGTPDQQETITIEDSSSSSSSEEVEPFDDIFASTFGKNKSSKKLSSSNNSTTSFTSTKNLFPSSQHSTSIHHTTTNTHPSAPPPIPPPTTSSFCTLTRPTPLPRRRPDTRRDLSPTLLTHAKLHTRTLHLIPRLPNHETFPWFRRYWIAVLLSTTTNPFKPTLSEKDFIWMKGNKFTTVSTIFHSYALATMADPEGLVMLAGGFEVVDMRDQVQELDYFGDRLVVFRALVGGGKEGGKGRSLVQGLVPVEGVVDLDLD